jgi:beta-xylosidase
MFGFSTLLALLPTVALAAPARRNALTKYTNPIIPGYRPDPSCVRVQEYFYCSTSTFNNFPGLPIYVSKDLINWRHVSNVIHREDQIPEYDVIPGQQQGIFAPTLRYHDETFYIIVTFMGARPEDDDPTIGGENTPIHFIFNSTDPLDPESWGAPTRYIRSPPESFDPDLFWDDDGQAYVTGHVFDYPGNSIYPIDVRTGEYGEYTNIWNGTGNIWPEAPHVYKKDDYYWLVLAEGGTSFNHQVTIARSREVLGPYEPFQNNPILTNTNTTQYFQSVGHMDLFQDTAGNWWGIALSIRQGPPDELPFYPMGRETVLFPVVWEENEWPRPEPVRGNMQGPLPASSRDVPGDGPWVNDDEDYSFGDALPLHFMHFRFPPEDMYEVSADGLRISPSQHNLTGGEDFVPSDRIAYVGRRQTNTYFTYFVDMDFTPESEGEEAGVTVFANQHQHADLGIVMLNETLYARLRSTAIGANPDRVDLEGSEDLIPVPEELAGQPLRLEVRATRDSGYDFFMGAATDEGELEFVGYAPASIMSGENAEFTGTTLGVFNTANGGQGTTPALFTRWVYRGEAQKIDFDEVVYVEL